MERSAVDTLSNSPSGSKLTTNNATRKSRTSRATKAKEIVRGNQVQFVPTQITSNLPMVRLCLGGEVVEIPEVLIEDESVFRNVLTKLAFWSLSDSARAYLKRFLPSAKLKLNQKADDDEKILDGVFTDDENFSFGSPLSKVFRKIKCGYFSGQHVADEVQLRSYRRVLYDHYIRHYYVNLLKKVLISRQVIMENVSKLNPQERVVLNPNAYYSKRKLKHSRDLELRAKIRAKKMIRDCKLKAAGEGDATSSDEYDHEENSGLQITLAPGAESTLYLKHFSEHDIDLHQPIRMKETKELLREYRHLCETEPDCPSCDISDICLEEVYERAGVSFQSERNFATNLAEKTHLQNNYRVNGSAHSLASQPQSTFPLNDY